MRNATLAFLLALGAGCSAIRDYQSEYGNPFQGRVGYGVIGIAKN